LARRLVDLPSVASELRAAVDSSDTRPGDAGPPLGALHRDVSTVRIPESVSVTAVLPTFGRYRYLAEVLEDLRAQTIKPKQIIIADGNAPEDQDRALYERFSDLPLQVIYHEGRGACAARNTCLPHTSGDYIWFVDDDSRFEPDNLEIHLRVMAAYGADVSVGPAFTRNRPELHPEQREIACGFMDCGTTVITRAMLEKIGGFDMQFSKNLPLEDSELGLRVIAAGGLMLNNPLAKRFHYLAPIGGGRRSRSNLHRWSRWAVDVPRPIQTVYYNARRHFEPEAVADAMFQACVLAGWRRPEGQRATAFTRARTLAAEIVAIPITLLRLRRSIALAQQMLDEGPIIPTLERPPSPQAHAR
jgi:GT2 family glycosyltransferase